MWNKLRIVLCEPLFPIWRGHAGYARSWFQYSCVSHHLSMANGFYLHMLNIDGFFSRPASLTSYYLFDLNKIRNESDLQKADLFTRDSLLCFAFAKDQDIAGSSVCDMLCHIDSVLFERQFCVKPPPLFVLCFWNVTYLGSKVTAKELWLGGSRAALKTLQDAALCSMFWPLPPFFFFFLLLQVNFERRHPSFTKSLKRNAK